MKMDELEKQRVTIKENLITTTNYEERRELQRQLGLLSSKISYLRRKASENK